MMINVGCWGKKHLQLHRFFAFKDIQIKAKAPFMVQADDCFLSETETRGSVRVSEQEAKEHPEYMSDAGEISWDLKIEKTIPLTSAASMANSTKNSSHTQEFFLNPSRPFP